MMVKKRLYIPCAIRTLFLYAFFMAHGGLLCTIMVGTSSLGSCVVTGTASVVTEPGQVGKVRKGDIVVAYTTNESWDYVLQDSSGIVTEKGGTASHAILLGKRLGIPVIVGVEGVMQHISDGDILTLDCCRRMVSKSLNNNFFRARVPVVTHLGYGGYCSVSSLESFCYDCGLLNKEEDEQKSDSFIVTTSKNSIDNNNDISDHRHNGIDFTFTRLQRDKTIIKGYIIDEVGANIAASERVSQGMACWFGGISEKVYHSRPLEFFKNKSEVEEVAEVELSDPETVEYIWQGILAFTRQGTSVTNEALGNFLFDKLVDTMNIEEEDRKFLKKNPAKMNDLVKNPGSMREDYMKFTARNLSIQYYLEKYYK